MRWTAGEKLGLRVNDESNSVTRVESNSPAQRAGLMVGDILTKVHDTGVDGTGHAAELLKKFSSPGGGRSSLRLEVRRAETLSASGPRKKDASPRPPAQAPKAKQPKPPAAAPAAALSPALSSEASRLQALISGEGVDVKGDIVKRLSAGEPETINFLSAMYPAAKTSKCLVCDKKFTLGGSSECLMLHKGEFCDYERKFCGHSEFGGTFSGQCKFCGEHVSAHGGEDDGPNPEDFGKCYCGPHVTSHYAVNKLKIQLRKERMELREFFKYMLEEHRELVTAEVEAEFPKHLSHWSKAPATVKQWFDAL